MRATITGSISAKSLTLNIRMSIDLPRKPAADERKGKAECQKLNNLACE